VYYYPYTREVYSLIMWEKRLISLRGRYGLYIYIYLTFRYYYSYSFQNHLIAYIIVYVSLVKTALLITIKNFGCTSIIDLNYISIVTKISDGEKDIV
jgi:hypothetical protein